MEFLHNMTSNENNLSSTTVPIPSPNGLTVQQILHVIYGILAFIAIFGNGLVFTIIATYRRGRMIRSGTNLLIASMAIMDMMTGITIYAMPTFVVPAKSYPYPKDALSCNIFCHIIASEYLLFYFGFGSVLTVTAIAVERWIAISRPFSYRKIVTTKRVKIYIVILWILCLFLSIDVMLQNEYVANSTIPCQFNSFARHQPGKSIFLALEIIRLFFPVLLTLICYADIARRTLFSSKVDALDQNSNRKMSIRRKSKRKVTIMSAIAALAFISCWLPNEIYFTLTAFNQTAYDLTTTRITKSLIILSSCLSPFIYSATNEEYRKGLNSLLRPIHLIDTAGCQCTIQYSVQISRTESSINNIAVLN
ncbi:Growth hormone secretagogue receptor type 1 [Trichoplax sp. H2]|nr:Growth hormone secretagogue receptor type 1 [Trichoplax sp. H2]|eukprot:RDD42806.1 Growth hormone secretagogue receptor type 1 [Trichoplax sp. H2]